MESITKTKLSPKQINQIVHKAFGNGVCPGNVEENNEGMFNTSYMITLSDEREVVLKLSPPPNIKVLRYEQDIIHTEVDVLRLLKSTRKIPVPEIYFSDYSRTIISCDYFIMEKLQGTVYKRLKESLNQKECEQIEVEIGEINKAINDIHGTEFGYFNHADKRRKTWSEAFMIMIDDILQDGLDQHIKLPLKYDQIRQMVASRITILDEVDIPCLVHMDLHTGNVIVKKGKIKGIIDCDRALWGDPLIETYFGYRPYPVDISNILKGYGSSQISTEKGKSRRILYDIYFYLTSVMESHYRGYSPEHKNGVYQLLQYELNVLEKL